MFQEKASKWPNLIGTPKFLWPKGKESDSVSVYVCYIYCGPLVSDSETQNIQSQKTTENQNF